MTTKAPNLPAGQGRGPFAPHGVKTRKCILCPSRANERATLPLPVRFMALGSRPLGVRGTCGSFPKVRPLSDQHAHLSRAFDRFLATVIAPSYAKFRCNAPFVVHARRYGHPCGRPAACRRRSPVGKRHDWRRSGRLQNKPRHLRCAQIGVRTRKCILCPLRANE
jgi:hypothetical protein